MMSCQYLGLLHSVRIQVSNKGKDIKKNDSKFEKHDQFLAAVQPRFLLNMFYNYPRANEEIPGQTRSTDELVTFILEMFNYFGVQI